MRIFMYFKHNITGFFPKIKPLNSNNTHMNAYYTIEYNITLSFQDQICLQSMPKHDSRTSHQLFQIGDTIPKSITNLTAPIKITSILINPNKKTRPNKHIFKRLILCDPEISQQQPSGIHLHTTWRTARMGRFGIPATDTGAISWKRDYMIVCTSGSHKLSRRH